MTPEIQKRIWDYQSQIDKYKNIIHQRDATIQRLTKENSSLKLKVKSAQDFITRWNSRFGSQKNSTKTDTM